MKRIAASFFSNDYSGLFTMETTIFRMSCDNKGNVTRDNRTPIDKLLDNELSRDEITVKVFSGSRNAVVGLANATYITVRPESNVSMQKRVFESTEQIGSLYASMQLNRLRLSFTNYDPPFASVLVLKNIEVLPEYRGKGIATSIVDYLFHQLAPTYMVAVILPVYTPVLDASIVSPAATERNIAQNFLHNSDFEFGGDVTLLMGGVRTLLPLYTVNNEEAMR